MFVTMSFSGSLNHSGEVPAEKQKEIAMKIAARVRAAVELEFVGGSGSVSVGDGSASISATAAGSL